MLVWLAVAGVVAGVLGLAVAIVTHARTTRIVDECAGVLRHHLQAVSGVADYRAVRDLAIVHYDALKEMSGQLSFSLALLNAVGDGVVISSINGRTETRTYAKIVESGQCLQPMSPEEEQALRAARLGQSTPPVRTEKSLDPAPAPGS